MIKKVDHVGLAVSNLDNVIDIFNRLFSLEPRTVDQDSIYRVAFLGVGGVDIEPLQPLDETISMAHSIEKLGNNIHHICFEVDDVDKELQRLAVMGVELLDKKGRPSFCGKVGFINPGSTDGILIELVEK